ncbi:hypothetical protein KFE25_009649 [Diacronema lutheri]|uniref:mannose-1-phosphate guanylyltransferase n=1 Tax=Diacronema lutheri TaxID=2081491 RepID=A0A8J5XMW9_DIALT|nr:hypothetical protein KFE25_009649 [Diacronema lutheri]
MTKALILVGGFGTRLRPLTLSKPKPLVEFCNKAQLLHQLEALAAAGVREVILAISYSPAVMEEFLLKAQHDLGIKVVCSHEQEPLGTAGPIAYARDFLNTKEDFFVVNSDITCAFPFAELLAFHKAHGREGTVLVTKVEEPSRYGVVQHDASGKVLRFVNKPKQFSGNLVNAGVAAFSPSVLARLQPKPASMEKEILPVMAQEEQLYCMPLRGYWLDIGSPKHHLLGAQLRLAHHRATEPAILSVHPAVVGDVLISPSATIGKGCLIGPAVVIGPNVVVHDGVHIERSTLLEGCVVGKHSYIVDSIIGWKSVIGQWVRVEGNTVLGESVTLSDEIYLNGGLVLPHKNVKESIAEPKIIM